MMPSLNGLKRLAPRTSSTWGALDLEFCCKRELNYAFGVIVPLRARGGCQHAASRERRYCNIERLPDDFVALIKKHNPHVIEIDLTSNQLRALPDDLHELTHLQALKVKYNRLEVVPPVCFKIQRCAVLDLAGNHIEAIPDDIVRLNALRELDVSGNHITSLTGMPSAHSAAASGYPTETTTPYSSFQVAWINFLTSRLSTLRITSSRHCPSPSGSVRAWSSSSAPQISFAAFPIPWGTSRRSRGWTLPIT